MTTARSGIRQRMAQMIGDYRSLVTTASAATTTAVITSAGLADYAEDIDSFPFWEAYFTTGANTGVNGGVGRPVKRTNGNTAPTLITVTRSYPGGIASGDTFELYRYPVDAYHYAITRAAEALYSKGLYLPVRDETLVVNDILANSDFESTVVAGAHPSWTNAGAGATISGEATIVRHGTQSAKIVAGGGAAGQMYQAPTINIHQVTGKTIRFACWVYCTATNTARIGLSFDGGSTFTYTSYHSGNDQWELLSVTTTIPSTATSVRVYLECVASGTGYFDAGFLIIRPVYRYTIPSGFVYGSIYQVLQQEYENHVEGPYYVLSDENPPVSGRRLRILGKNYLSRPTTETGTMEVTGDQLDIVCFQALAFLFQSLAEPGGQNSDAYLRRALEFQGRTDEMLKMSGVKPHRMTALVPEAYRIERDGTTYYLWLTDDRG